MTEGKIFLVGQNSNQLIPMIATGYTTEDVLQLLLTQYPDLLPGDQINPEAPRRWLLVAREMGVPGAEHETGRWSLDHLFLDQDAIPTFVECKRATDTRARREVVAQMLDYAANGIKYWGMDRLRQAAAETARAQGLSLDEQVLALLEGSDETDIESYWSIVERNLREGRVRLIFVGDRTPVELRRLVEFLNEKLEDVEVLAVEVRRFTGEGQTALVSRVVGLTESARARKSSPSRQHTSRAEFLSQLPPGVITLYEQVLDAAEKRGHTVYWGTKGFSLRALLEHEQQRITFMYGWPDGRLQFYFAQLPLPTDEALQLRQKLMDFGFFTPSGEKTLTVQVENVPAEGILEMYDFVLERVGEIMHSY